MRPSPGSVGLGLTTAAIVAAVVAGLFVLGSPREERARRLDGRRVTDLRAIARATDLFWTRHARLPASLDEVAAEPGVAIRAGDPASAEEYGYRPVDTLKYEVCARFDRPSEGALRIAEEAVWAHGSGRQCFQFDAEVIDGNRQDHLPGPDTVEPQLPARREDPNA